MPSHRAYARPLSRPAACWAAGIALPGLLYLIACTPLGSTSTVAPAAQPAPREANALNRALDGETDPWSRGLIGSAHDFTDGDAGAHDLCTPCHVPHVQRSRLPQLDPSPAAAERLAVYTAPGVALDSTSLMCLSCHDGLSASDVFTATHATRLGAQFGTSPFQAFGQGGHPIGVRYPIAHQRYHAPAVVGQSLPLPEGRVQCVSCHDPHNTQRHESMLIRSNGGSRLCLACHRI